MIEPKEIERHKKEFISFIEKFLPLKFTKWQKRILKLKKPRVVIRK